MINFFVPTIKTLAKLISLLCIFAMLTYPSLAQTTNQINSSKDPNFPNDIAVDTCEIIFQAWYDNSYNNDGFYSNRPVSQAMPVVFRGVVENVGITAHSDVSFTTEIHDTSSNLLFIANDTIAVLGAGGWHSFDLDSNYIPTGTGRKFISMFCNQAETDHNPPNNFADTVSFNISAKKMISRHRSYNDNYSPAEYGWGDGYVFGIYFYISNYDTVKSLSVFIDSASTAGVLIGQLYNVSLGLHTLQIETAEHYIQCNDTSFWIEMPFLTISPEDDFLESEQLYFAGVELYTLGNDLYVGSDTLGPHNYAVETNLRDTAGNIINEIPMMTVNLGPQDPIGIDKPDNSSVVESEVYPNPFINYFTVESGSVSHMLELYSISGEKVSQINSVNKSSITLETAHLPGGIYILKITDNDTLHLKKLIKRQR